MAVPAWACVPSFAAESQAASGNGRSTGASARHRSPCLPASSAALTGTAWLARDTNLIQKSLGIRNVAGLTRRQYKAQGDTVGVADHVNLGGQAASAAPQRMVYRLFWPPFSRRQKRLGWRAQRWSQSSRCPGQSALPDSGERVSAREPDRKCRHLTNHETADTPSTRGQTALASRARQHLNTGSRRCH